MRLFPDAEMAEQAAACEKLGVKTSLANLMTFPWIAEATAARELRLHGWYFDIVKGALCALDTKNEEFRPVDDLFPLA
jgi:carbonic anhydrase